MPAFTDYAQRERMCRGDRCRPTVFTDALLSADRQTSGAPAVAVRAPPQHPHHPLSSDAPSRQMIGQDHLGAGG